MFKKKNVQKLTVTNLISIDGYIAGQDGNLYVAQVDDLMLFTGINNKPNNGVRALIVTAKIPPTNRDAIKQCGGDRIILVDKKFMRLSKKEKLALIEIENQKLKSTIDSRMTKNYEPDTILGTNKDKQISAELAAMEKYGYRITRKAIQKSNNRVLNTQKKTGKYLYKNYKKASVDGVETLEEIEMPITLENA